MDLLEIALSYWRRGWSIIPIKAGTKKPPSGLGWKAYQTKRADEKQLAKWFAKDVDLGLAVTFGEVSGGLICRDFDSMEAYNAWAESFPTLAAELPTVETGRPGGGRHVYCRGDISLIREASKTGNGCIITFDDGELRGGGYCVLPPSRHPKGPPYRWLISLPAGDVPFVDLYEAGFLKNQPCHREHRVHRENGVHRDDRVDRENGVKQSVTEATEPTENGFRGSLCSPSHSVPLCGTPKLDDQIERAIVDTLPNRPGKRNRQVFELARALKAISAIADASPADLKPFVREWHQLALPHISTKPFEETWIDFHKAWKNVKFPRGAEPVREAFKRALAADLPDVALQYDGEKCRHLLALCRELQRQADKGPFYLSCRTAGALLDVDFTTANRWLFLFAEDRILEVVSRGNQETRRASRFRYLAEL